MPAVVAGLLLFASWRVWAPDDEGRTGPGGPLLGALAFAGAHLVGHVLLRDGPPPAPWADRVLPAQAWLFWIVAAAGILATLEARMRPGTLAVWIPRLPLAVLTVALLLRAKLQNTWDGTEGVAWAAGLFLWMVAAWGALGRAGRHRGPAVPVLMVAAISGLSVAVGLSGSGFLAQLAGATAAGFGAAAVLSLRARRLRLDGGALSTAFVALSGVGLVATFYNELPGASAAAFALVPLALGAAELPALQRRPGAAALVRWGLTLALVALGTGIVAATYEPDPYGY